MNQKLLDPDPCWIRPGSRPFLDPWIRIHWKTGWIQNFTFNVVEFKKILKPRLTFLSTTFVLVFLHSFYIIYHLSLEVNCIRYELRLFMLKAFALLKLIMTSTGWGAVSTIYKFFGMTRTRTWDLPIRIQMCYLALFWHYNTVRNYKQISKKTYNENQRL